MAKGSTKGPSRRKKRGIGKWIFRGLALAVLVAIVFIAWFWWDMRQWRPDEVRYPEQGAVIANGAPRVHFETLGALGAGFVYLELARVNDVPDPGFAPRFRRAQSSDLKSGVIFPFDPCMGADRQSALFTRMVPRDADLLPPAIALDHLAENCASPVSDAAVESELLTLVNQIETHAGKPVILKLGRDFEARHGTARTLARDLWLMRNRARPDYAGRPWVLWSANSHLVSEASSDPIEWVVVQP